MEDTAMLHPMIQCMYTPNPAAAWDDLNEGITRARKLLGIAGTPSFWLVLETGPFASYTSLSLIMYF